MSTDFNETPGAARYRKPGGSALKQMWKNPILKMIVVVAVVGGVGLAGTQFMRNRTTEQESVIRPAQVGVQTESRDTQSATPEYQRAVAQLDETRAEEARGRGESALPTPMSNPVASPTLDNNIAALEARDPLRDFESMINAGQPPPPQPPEPAPQVNEAAPPAVSPEVVQNLSRGYRTQMDMLMGQWTPPSITVVEGHAEFDDSGSAGGDGGSGQTPATNNNTPPRQIVSAGSVYYGQMLLEANSDVPGPIMAQVLTGPLAGGKAIGSFETFRNHLVVRFNTVALRGKQITVDILALDPETTLGGVVTEVDPRYFSRVLLPAAAAFVRAFGETLSEPSGTTTVSGSGSSSITTTNEKNDSRDALFKGVGAAADRVGQFVDEQASATKRLVRVAVGTPIGLFFVSPVTEQNNVR